MSFTFTNSFSLGVQNTGLADLRARPKTAAYVDTADSLITTGFTEIGKGIYAFTGTVADTTAYVLVYSLADSTKFSIRETVPLVSAGQTTVGAIATDAITAAALAASAVAEIQSGLSTYAGTDTPGTTTLLTNVATVATYVDTEVAAIKAKTDLIPASPLTAADIPSADQIALAVEGVVNGSAPRVYRIDQVRTALTSGKTLVVGVGDSEMCQTATPRMFGGAIRSWDMDIAGVFIPYLGSSYEGYAVSANTTNIANTGILPGVAFNDAVMNRYPLAFRQMVWGANTADGSLVASFALQNLSSYVRGDWTVDNAMTARMIYRRTLTNVTSVDRGATRNGSTFGTVVTTNFSGADSLQYVESPFVAPNATSTDPSMQLYTAGGESENGKTLYLGGVWIYLPSADGVRLMTIAQGGDTTLKHLDPSDSDTGTYNDAGLQATLAASDAANMDSIVVMVQLGQNTATDETIGSNYYNNVQAILTRYREAFAAINAPEPLFCLRMTWDTNTVAESQYDRMEAALYRIARESDDVSFVNLRRLILDSHGPYADWQATYLADGVHQTQAGTVEFERLFWDAGVMADDSTSSTLDSINTATGTTIPGLINTLTARIGAFTGTGVNTILGFFKALMSKTASTPSDVGGTFAAADDSTEAIRDRGDAAWITGAGSGGSVIVAPLQTSVVNPTFTINGGTLINLDIPQNGSSAWLFTVMDAAGDALDLDGKTIQLTVHDPYDRIQFAVESGSSDGGSISIGGADNNQLTVEVDETSTEDAGAFSYKLWNKTDRDVLASGKFTIKGAPLQV